MKLSDLVGVEPRFARSANVERDHDLAAVAGYLPTGRALDLLRRIKRGLQDPGAGRAFSITGPQGSGKSSFAVFLRALLEDPTSPSGESARESLRVFDPALAGEFESALRRLGSDNRVHCAFVTAQGEPVAATLGRAIFGDEKAATPTPRMLLDRIRELASEGPLVILVDEFGKNLEAYASSRTSSDPYLLQQIAEMSQGARALPIFLITMQHLAFEEYVGEASTTRRREWSKVQGRFQDIPYVETPEQSRHLIISTLRHHPAARDLVRTWRAGQQQWLDRLGLGSLGHAVESAWPLHPLTLAVLPELCGRYGQSERTMFSFLAGCEPRALPTILDRTEFDPSGVLPTVGLDRVYEYFLDSAVTSVGAAAGASRWLEIESRIRDAFGLDQLQSRVVRTIGLLNLVSTGGSVRACDEVLRWALEDLDPAVVEIAVDELQASGLITYRQFADEYRVWAGSDFDVRAAIELNRHEVEQRCLADLLNDHCPLEPGIAGRHSQTSGVLRVFSRGFMDPGAIGALSELTDPQFDGQVLYLTGVIDDTAPNTLPPRTLLVGGDVEDRLREAAIETAALSAALHRLAEGPIDWVARNELLERHALARQALRSLVDDAWGPKTSRWILAGSPVALDPRKGLSAVLSQAADAIYPRTPQVRNEMIARRELTSQGAKARRMLIDAMIAHPEDPAFRIAGYPPHRAIYEAIFAHTGMHRSGRGRPWALQPPKDPRWRVVWQDMDAALSRATDERIGLDAVAGILTSPPFGLKDGIVPLLLVAILLHRNTDLALYEHGTLVLTLDDAVAERLAKNLSHFSVKHIAADQGPRREVTEALIKMFETRGTSSDQPSFLRAAQALFRSMRKLSPYAQQTRRVSDSAVAVRAAFMTASEPDVLLYEAIPEALGIPALSVATVTGDAAVGRYMATLSDALLELTRADSDLLRHCRATIAAATSVSGGTTHMRERLRGLALQLGHSVLDPRLRAFIAAAARQDLLEDEWLSNLSMVIANGKPPQAWTDSDVHAFELRARELGGAFIRTLNLSLEHANETEGFLTERVTMTRPSGRERHIVITASPSEISVSAPHVEDVIERLTTELGSREAAMNAIRAVVLGVRQDEPTDTVDFNGRRKEAASGA